MLMFEAHQDTVPVDGMTIEPFAAEDQGRPALWPRLVRHQGGPGRDDRGPRPPGRGKAKRAGRPSCWPARSTKSTASPGRRTGRRRIPASRPSPSGPPAAAASACRRPPAGRSKLLPARARCCIVAEPTRLNVVVAHKGAVRWRCHTDGIATHSSQPHLGDNAIYHMARVLQVLEQYATRRRARRSAAHPLVRPSDAQRRPHLRRHQRQHRPRPGHDRDRPPRAARRRPAGGLRPRHRFHQLAIVPPARRSFTTRRSCSPAAWPTTTTATWPSGSATSSASTSAARASGSASPSAPTPRTSPPPAARRSSSAPAASTRPTPPTNGSTSTSSARQREILYDFTAAGA